MVSYLDLAIKPSEREYNRYAFSGTKNGIAGMFASYLWKRLLFQGEAAVSENGGKALIGSLVSDLSPSVHISILGRKYDPQFHSFYARAFGEDSRNSNENGVYFGLRVKPSRFWVIGLFYDRFRFPWLRFNADAPSVGSELMMSVNHRSAKGDEVRFQFRLKSKERNYLPENSAVNTLVKEDRYYLRLDGKKVLTEHWWFRSRLQLTSYMFTKNQSHGIIVAQDFGYQVKSKLDLSARMAYFKTDNWYTRQYIYERDLLYSYTVPAFYGEGLRAYLFLAWHIRPAISVWTKGGFTQYFDRDIVGSGLDATEGDSRTAFSLQLRIRM
jgi:hypothetical protein